MLTTSALLLLLICDAADYCHIAMCSLSLADRCIKVHKHCMTSNAWNACRFSTAHREYTYFIVQHGQLDIAAMQQSATYFLGEHDFRNFCKLDLEHVKSFRRRILDFQIKEVQPAGTDGRALYALHIKGTAFLWHQVGLASLSSIHYDSQKGFVAQLHTSPCCSLQHC